MGSTVMIMISYVTRWTVIYLSGILDFTLSHNLHAINLVDAHWDSARRCLMVIIERSNCFYLFVCLFVLCDSKLPFAVCNQV